MRDDGSASPDPEPNRRAGRPLALVALLALLASLGATPVAAAGPLAITTDYPSVSLQPGASASFPLTITVPSAESVSLALSGAPDGWSAALHGGGFVVDSVYVLPDASPELKLDVSVPADAAEGSYPLTVTASARGATATLVVAVKVAKQAGGTVELSSDFPNLSGPSTQSYSFNVNLANHTPEELTFSLQAAGPEGWTVTAKPSGQSLATTMTVPAGGTRALTVQADPPDQAAADTYAIAVQAVGPGGETATLQLNVAITGAVEMALSTNDGRLNANATAGEGRDLQLVLGNSGTAPLSGVTLTAQTPSDWKVTFDTPTVDSVAPGTSANVTATIQPSADAIAGDYVVTIRASSKDANDSVEIRVTVETSPLWGLVGAALIVAAVGGLAWVFQRYGRR
jgi:uncharacterized membrane protein